jgi:hypothetical protein
MWLEQSLFDLKMSLPNNLNDSKEYYISILRYVFLVCSIGGLIFSSLLIYLLVKRAKAKIHSDIVLTIISVLVDSIASGGLLFRSIFTVYPYNMLSAHLSWCAYDYIVHTFILVYSGYIISVLSLERMLLIVFNVKVPIYFWLLLSLSLYLIPAIQVVYNYAVNNFGLSPLTLNCITISSPNSKPLLQTLLILGIITYFTTILSYLSIIIFSCKQCLNQLNLNMEKAVIFKQCRMIIFKSLFFLIPYMVMYSGKIYCWFYEISTGLKRTWDMEYIATLLSALTVIINCLTVLYMNKQVNKDFVDLILPIKKLIMGN